MESIDKRVLNGLKPCLPRVSAVISIILLWEAAGRILEIRPEILPTPARILLEISGQADRLRAHSLISGFEILGGFILAVACSIPAAILLAWTPRIYRASSPILSALRPAPMVILVPLILVWFGFGIRPEILMAFSLCFITIMAGMMAGLQSVSTEVVELLQMMGASRAQIFFKARLPASLPSTFVALKAAVPLAMLGTTAGEFAQAEMGLGHLMLAAAFKMETPQVFAALTILGLIGLVLYGAVAMLERILLRS